ncbi:hypothetical protein FRC12_023081 [Ceratobasidium sp. 428]|nr:hypothetical protein FRC12_023081 [Ceratobasidium sp. 428]
MCVSGQCPRIVYIRDFGVSSPWASKLFSALQSAISQAGPPSGASDSSARPFALVLGFSPPLFVKSTRSQKPSRRGFFFLFQSSNSDSDDSEESESESDERVTQPWAEGEEAEPLRTKRLQKRIKQWHKDSLLKKELTPLGLKVTLLGNSGDKPSDAPGKRGYIRSCILMPTSRDPSRERTSREQRRQELNSLRAQIALAAVGAKISAGLPKIPTDPEDLRNRWALDMADSKVLSHVVDHIAATTSVDQTRDGQLKLVSWNSISDAWRVYDGFEGSRVAWIEAKIKASSENPVDMELERVKKMDLSRHERKMLRCVVNPAEINASFDSVHLPDSTVDRIRTLISLPLLHPEIFQLGILKQHSMAGALLFGPPGTGKTLIARAVAKDSGARMIAIKPSDIQDMYVGESEKIVTAVFRLARRLTPCLIFIDEIDAILGARSSQADNNSARFHASLITQFMQEMDGLLASKVVVIGATNRPFDLDDAVLRRLPCRILVDLPGQKAREEILRIMLRDETLAPDVSHEDLASKTEHYSGSDLKRAPVVLFGNALVLIYHFWRTLDLCISAVLAAVKEQVDVPWKAPVPLTPSSSGPTHLACSTSATSQAPIPDPASQEDASSTLDEIDAASGCNRSMPPPSVIVSGEASSEIGASLLLSDSAVQLESTGASKLATFISGNAETPSQRVLYRRHFAYALVEVKPSSSEKDMSVRELRRWDTKLGAGGSNHQESAVATPSLSLHPGGFDSPHPFSVRLEAQTTGLDQEGSQSEAGGTSVSREPKKAGWGWKSGKLKPS